MSRCFGTYNIGGGRRGAISEQGTQSNQSHVGARRNRKDYGDQLDGKKEKSHIHRQAQDDKSSQVKRDST